MWNMTVDITEGHRVIIAVTNRRNDMFAEQTFEIYQIDFETWI
jgi:hypothetical protein